MSKLRRRMKGGTVNTNPVRAVSIVDNHNLLFRCINVANSHDVMDDNYTYWKYLIMNQLFGFVAKFSPDRLIIAQDSSDVWRKDVFPDYKGNRKGGLDKSPIDFDKFFPVANKFYDDLFETFPNIVALKVPRCEADDIIAVLVRDIIKKPVTVITTDKDMYQLMKNSHYQQYNPIQKKIVRSINPQRDLDVKLIMGDRGDNISAIRPRVGPATAMKILDAGLEEVLEDEECKKLYIRNKTLIDFDCIPQEYVDNITEAYENVTIGAFDGTEVFNFLMRHKLGMFIESYQTSANLLKKLR